jgi:TrmH family RNA methyltransferase
LSTPAQTLSGRNPRVQRLRRLAHRRRDRDAEGVLLLEGPHLVDDALDHGHALEAIYAEPALAAGYAARAPRGVACHELAEGTLTRVLDTVTPQGVVAVAPQPTTDLDSIGSTLAAASGPGACAVVLAGVADPGNAGAVLRSAEAAGFGAVLFGGGSVDPFSPKCVRASAGSVLHIPVDRVADTPSTLRFLGEIGLQRVGTRASGGRAYGTASFLPKLAMVIGSEARGIDDAAAAEIDTWVHIPMAGRVESLNAAVAASVLCFEVARRMGDGA